MISSSFREIELTKQITDQEDNINLGQIVFDDNNQERKSWALWDKPVPDR